MRYLLKQQDFLNPRPLFPEQLFPEYELIHSIISRHWVEGLLQEEIGEYWRRDSSILIWIRLFPRRSQKEALEWGQGLFSLSPTSPPVRGIGRPDCGSFSGQTIGEYCWCSGFATKSVDGQTVQRRLFTIAGNNLVMIQLEGKIVDEKEVEYLALALAERLKTWHRPGLFAPLFPGRPVE